MRFASASIFPSGRCVMSMSVEGDVTPHFIKSITFVPPAMNAASFVFAIRASASRVSEGCRRSNACTSHLLTHGGENVRVGAAPAQIAAHCLANLTVGMRVPFVQHSERRND